jgi:hypothetical protein
MKSEGELLTIAKKMSRLRNPTGKQLMDLLGDLTREDLKRLMDVSAELAELHRRKAEAVEGIGQLLEEHDKESGENITAGDLLRHYHRTGNATKLRALKRWWRQHDQAEAELHELDRK